MRLNPVTVGNRAEYAVDLARIDPVDEVVALLGNIKDNGAGQTRPIDLRSHVEEDVLRHMHPNARRIDLDDDIVLTPAQILDFVDDLGPRGIGGHCKLDGRPPVHDEAAQVLLGEHAEPFFQPNGVRHQASSSKWTE